MHLCQVAEYTYKYENTKRAGASMERTGRMGTRNREDGAGGKSIYELSGGEKKLAFAGAYAVPFRA